MQLSLAIPRLPARDAIEAAADVMSALGEPRVQLDATRAGLRPRELDRSARRDLAAMLKRRACIATGADLFIPPEHFAPGPDNDRATAAAISTIELLAELSSLGGAIGGHGAGGVGGECVLCLQLPAKPSEQAMKAIDVAAADKGVAIVDFGLPPATNLPVHIVPGIDCAQVLAAGQEPAARVASGVGAVRLCDWDGVRRVVIGRGRLDVQALAVAASIAPVGLPVILDLRGVADSSSGETDLAKWESSVRLSVEAWNAALPRA